AEDVAAGDVGAEEIEACVIRLAGCRRLGRVETEQARVKREQAEEAARLAGGEEAKIAALVFVLDGSDVEVLVDEAARGMNEWTPGALEMKRRRRRPL